MLRVYCSWPGVADDELAPVGGEVAVGHVDGDALFALGRQAVGELRQIHLAARASRPCQVVLQHGAAIDQQAPISVLCRRRRCRR